MKYILITLLNPILFNEYALLLGKANFMNLVKDLVDGTHRP